MHVLRSLLFYVIFYAASVYYVTASVVMVLVAPHRVRRYPDAWSRFHRACLRHLLGIHVREIGNKPPGPILYAIKHESFFEAIDLPNTLDHPVPFGKQELFSIPGWGRAAKAYGAVSVARDEGAKALRTMVTEARVHAAINALNS